MENHSLTQNELECLISQVVSQVKRRLEGGGGPWLDGTEKQRNVDSQDMWKNRDVILLSGPLSREEEQSLSSVYQIERNMESREWDVLLFTHLSLATMAYAAHGIPGNEEAAGILFGLLSGKKVFVLERGLEYRGFRDSPGKNLYRLYLQQEALLKNIGVEVISCVTDVARTLLGVMDHSDRRSDTSDITRFRNQMDVPGGSVMDFTRVGLLRESDVMRARNAGGQSLLVGKNTKITPLAMDYIAGHRLSVVRQ